MSAAASPPPVGSGGDSSKSGGGITITEKKLLMIITTLCETIIAILAYMFNDVKSDLKEANQKIEQLIVLKSVVERMEQELNRIRNALDNLNRARNI